MEKRLMMFLVGLFLSLGTALAQTEISGTVVSSEDGLPVVGGFYSCSWHTDWVLSQTLMVNSTLLYLLERISYVCNMLV